MTERELFEKVCSVPDTMIRWDEASQSYVSVRGGLSMTADTYNDRLRIWQVARAAAHEGMAIVPVEKLKEWAHDLDAEINARDIAEQMQAIIENQS